MLFLWLKCFLETRLSSESFDPQIGFLAYLESKCLVLHYYSHNFGSRYASKPINGSKDLDDSLDSKINLSQKMACWVGPHGQVSSATRAKTCPHYDVTQRKPHTQNKKIFPFELQDLLNL